MQLTIRHNLKHTESGTRLQMWVDKSDLEIPAVFVHSRDSDIPSKEDSDIFVDIASHACMNDYPVNDPGTGTFFRKLYADILIESSAEVDAALEGIQRALLELRSYNA